MEKQRHVLIVRDQIGRKQSTGIIIVQDETGKILMTSQALERGWVNNENNISCIPAGTYDLVLEWSPKFKSDLWELYGVPNRRECKFHVANFWDELNGCIAPGLDQKDINGDGLVDNTNSRPALNKFHAAMKGFTKASLRVVNNRFG